MKEKLKEWIEKIKAFWANRSKKQKIGIISGAAGILLYDVNPADNPNGALVVSGIVDWAQCREHAGATATAETMKGILPGVTFRENTGVNAADAV